MNQQEAKKKITDLIRLKIKELTEENQVVFELTDLFISNQDFNLDKEFMNSLCKEYERNGFFIRYKYHVSFIWRHRFIISKKPIENYLPHDGYECGWFATEKERKEFDKAATAFMADAEKMFKE